MILFPAIDLVGGEAVRLYQGDFNKKTVYSSDPLAVAMTFKEKGATHIHLVDLDGAKKGESNHFELITRIKKESGLFAEVGGGIRTKASIEKYLAQGIDRVILGTVAVEDPAFVPSLPQEWMEHIAVGVDVLDGKVAIKGWTQKSDYDLIDFCKKMQDNGVGVVISTDIGRDGAMRGTNLSMYKELSEKTDMKVIASGGVSSMEDILRLKEGGAYGAIIGKAYYVGAIDLSEAIKEAQ